MKVYVASHDRWAALWTAHVLREHGHEITSRWIDAPFNPTDAYDEEDRRRIATEDAEDVAAADVLVLVAGPDRYSGGKFVEVGIALGLGKRVICIGRRENMLLWHPLVYVTASPTGAALALEG